VALARQTNLEQAVTDVEAAIEYLRKETVKKCGAIGYCFGGTMAWLSASRLDLDAVVGYYGGQIARFSRENPQLTTGLRFPLVQMERLL
jgi:carboxymethylenebutenolidase